MNKVLEFLLESDLKVNNDYMKEDKYYERKKTRIKLLLQKKKKKKSIKTLFPARFGQ